MTGQSQSAQAVPMGEANWHNIEPVLKWGGVAYVFGFGIVMYHTYRLGIPTLQLIDPVNIWIGTPVTILTFFSDKIYFGAKKSVGNLMQSFRDTAGMRGLPLLTRLLYWEPPLGACLTHDAKSCWIRSSKPSSGSNGSLPCSGF